MIHHSILYTSCMEDPVFLEIRKEIGSILQNATYCSEYHDSIG